MPYIRFASFLASDSLKDDLEQFASLVIGSLQFTQLVGVVCSYERIGTKRHSTFSFLVALAC
jgi:hypothetical protein